MINTSTPVDGKEYSQWLENLYWFSEENFQKFKKMVENVVKVFFECFGSYPSLYLSPQSTFGVLRLLCSVSLEQLEKLKTEAIWAQLMKIVPDHMGIVASEQGSGPQGLCISCKHPSLSKNLPLIKEAESHANERLEVFAPSLALKLNAGQPIQFAGLEFNQALRNLVQFYWPNEGREKFLEVEQDIQEAFCQLKTSWGNPSSMEVLLKRCSPGNIQCLVQVLELNADDFQQVLDSLTQVSDRVQKRLPGAVLKVSAGQRNFLDKRNLNVSMTFSWRGVNEEV